MEHAELADCLFVEGARIRCLVKVQVASEYLVRTFTAEHHLDTHTLDDSRKQVHRRGGTDRGHIVGLYMVDYIADGIKALLDGIIDLVVDGTEVVRHLARLGEVRCSLEANGETVEARPPGYASTLVFHSVDG